MVDMKEVSSSNVHSVGFDPDTKMLHVKYRNGGGVYTYAGVDAEKHKNLMAADSVGSFIHKNIKGQHTHTKLAGDASD